MKILAGSRNNVYICTQKRDSGQEMRFKNREIIENI